MSNRVKTEAECILTNLFTAIINQDLSHLIARQLCHLQSAIHRGEVPTLSDLDNALQTHNYFNADDVISSSLDHVPDNIDNVTDKS